MSKIKFASFWHGRPFSKIEKMAISSFLYYGHEFHFYSYEKFDVPDGAILHNANEILPESKIFMFENTYSMFADIFRYKMLLENPQYCWVDMDCICLTSDLSTLFSKKYVFAEHQGGIVTNGILRVDGDQSFLSFLYKRASAISLESMTWASTSTALISEAVKRFRLQKYVLPEETFFEIKYEELHKYFSSEYKEELQKRLFDKPITHLWNSGYQREGFDSGYFDKNSFLGDLEKKFLTV